jgi:hypothetical protein
MLLSAANVSNVFVSLIARFETRDWHEMWHRIASKLRRRPDAA